MNGMPLSGLFLEEKDKHPSYEQINKIFLKSSIKDIKTYKLKNVFGSHAWIVSLKGVKKTHQDSFPSIFNL